MNNLHIDTHASNQVCQVQVAPNKTENEANKIEDHESDGGSDPEYQDICGGSANDKPDNYHELVSKLRSLFNEEYHDNKHLYTRQDYERIMDKSNDWHCARYLNHFLMDLDRAFAGMKHTLRWRKEIGIDKLSDSSFPKEMWHYSPFFKCGKSLDGTVMFYLVGAYYKVIPEPVKSLMRSYFYYYIEKLELAHPNGDKVYVTFNETNSSVVNFEIDTIKWLITIRDNWPDRVKAVLVVGLPFFLRPIVRVIITWLPKEWRNIIKVGTIEQLVFDNVDQQQLPWLLGGQIDATCRLAPTESKWATDMEFFKDQTVLDKFYQSVCFHATDEEREMFAELQNEKDRANKIEG